VAADLPDISEIAPGYSSAGYPEEFSELFADSRVRLVRAGRGRVIAFRNEEEIALCGESPHCQARASQLHEMSRPGGALRAGTDSAAESQIQRPRKQSGAARKAAEYCRVLKHVTHSWKYQ
jgi:hypothetical protein